MYSLVVAAQPQPLVAVTEAAPADQLLLLGAEGAGGTTTAYVTAKGSRRDLVLTGRSRTLVVAGEPR